MLPSMTEVEFRELTKRLDETRDLAARGFQGVSRDLAQVQRQLADLQRLVEGLLNWVGREAVARPAAFYGGEARLTVNFEVHPGSFSSNETVDKEFICDVLIKNVGTAIAE